MHGDGPCPSRNKSHSVVTRLDDVRSGGPGAPPMAEPGRYEGIRQAQLLGLPNLPGRPLRNAVESLAQFSATQKQTEVIRQQSLPRWPAAVATCCRLQPSARSLSRAPSCCPSISAPVRPSSPHTVRSLEQAAGKRCCSSLPLPGP